MNVMIRTDFVTMGKALLQLLGICIVVVIFISIGTQSLSTGIAAGETMIPFMYIFSIAAYDELNGWERFRLTLPITRHQVVLGRYASIFIITLASGLASVILAALMFFIFSNVPNLPAATPIVESFDPITNILYVLLASVIVIFTAAITQPLFMRFGMSKGTRYVPILVVFLLILVLFVFGPTLIEFVPILEPLLSNHPESILTVLGLSAGIFAISMVLYLISAAISLKLYEGRQF